MACLADLVLGAGEVDELELEDEELARELEELKALRAAANPSSAAAPDLQSTSTVPRTPAAQQHSKVSLADRISDDVDDVDREFQAMEDELQQQLLQYKEQCQGTSPVAAAQAPPAAAAPDAATTAGSTSWPSRPSSKESAHGKEQPLSSTAGF